MTSRRFSVSASESLFWGLRWSGVNRLVCRSGWRQRRLQILCYHGISIRNEHECFDLYVSQDHLRQRLTWLRQAGFAFVPLEDGLRMLRDGRLPQRAVAVTFDDGGYDFAARALPVLESEGVPVTLYVSTYYVRRQLPVFDPYLRYLLWVARDRELQLPESGIQVPIDLRDEAGRLRAWNQVTGFARSRQLDAVAKDDLLRHVAAALRIDDRDLRAVRVMHLMRAAEIASLPSFVDVQLHTHRHRTPGDRELFLQELRENAEVISELRPGRATRHFCYPSGIYSAAMVQWLAESGIESATTCDPEIAERHTNPLLLPRFIDTMGVSLNKFAAWVSGTAPMIRRRIASGGRAATPHSGE